MKKVTTLLLLALAVLLSGCITVPTLVKGDIKAQHPSKEFVKKLNYISLLKYWDDHATKATIDFKSATYSKIWEHNKTAEITIGNGPYYGLIVLTSINHNTTNVKYHSWGGLGDDIDSWVDLIKNAPE
jgi:uncharacterized protein YceK